MKLAVQVFLAEGLAVALLLGLLAGGVYWRYDRMRGDYTKVVGTNWGLHLPEALEEVYATDSGTASFGEGMRYHVLQYGVGINPGQTLPWQRGPEEKITTGTTRILEQLRVPQERRPELTGAYQWYFLTEEADGDLLYLIWEPTVWRLYVTESFR